MGLKQQLDADLKQAMLTGDKTLTTTLRGLKSAILYAEVAAGAREAGLDEKSIVELLTRESKKRQESADLYLRGGNKERAEAELVEKTVIAKYLPVQLSDEALGQAIDEVLAGMDLSEPNNMGKAIGMVKQSVGASADGARIASLIKGRMT